MGALDATCGGSCAVGVWISPDFRKPSVQETAERKARDRSGARFHSAEMATGQRRIPALPGPSRRPSAVGGMIRSRQETARDRRATRPGVPHGRRGWPAGCHPPRRTLLADQPAGALGIQARVVATGARHDRRDQFEPTNLAVEDELRVDPRGRVEDHAMPAPVRRDLEQPRSEFGDMNIVVGDPTGQIRCVVHKDVVQADSDAIRKGGVLTPEERPPSSRSPSASSTCWW